VTPDPAALKSTVCWLSIVAVWWVFALLATRTRLASGTLWMEAWIAAGLALTYVALWAIAALSSRFPPRQFLLRGLATTGACALLLLVLELPALVGMLNYASLLNTTSISEAFVVDSDVSFRRPPLFSWRGHVRSDLSSAWNVPLGPPKEISFTTDSQGFRNLATRQETDVVLIGDSYVEGWYVSDEDTAAAVLERRLNRPVSNLGVSGFGTLQELAVLQRYALPKRPRLVAWFFFEGNDLYDDRAFEDRSRAGFDRDSGGLGIDQPSGVDWGRFRRASFARNAYGVLRRMSHGVMPKALPPNGLYRDQTGTLRRMAYHDYASQRFTDLERDRLERTTGAFREGVELGREEGVSVVLFFVPMKFRVYGEFCVFASDSPCREWEPWELPTRFAGFCEEEGFDCVDLSEPMRQAAAAGQLLYAPEDTHWNEAGHVFVAEQVKAVWDRLGLDARQTIGRGH
jgi:hypothetical protein